MNKPHHPTEAPEVIAARHLNKAYRKVCDKLTEVIDAAITNGAWITVTELFLMSDVAIVFYRNGERHSLADLYNKLYAFSKHFDNQKGTPA